MRREKFQKSVRTLLAGRQDQCGHCAYPRSDRQFFIIVALKNVEFVAHAFSVT
jgi:hypothetical protein